MPCSRCLDRLQDNRLVKLNLNINTALTNSTLAEVNAVGAGVRAANRRARVGTSKVNTELFEAEVTLLRATRRWVSKADVQSVGQRGTRTVSAAVTSVSKGIKSVADVLTDLAVTHINSYIGGIDSTIAEVIEPPVILSGILGVWDIGAVKELSDLIVISAVDLREQKPSPPSLAHFA